MDITTTDFEREVIEGSKQQPVLVDFWAPWCGPCRALTPVLEKLAAEYGERVKLVKINSDENPEISTAFGIRSIPNVIAFRDGKAVSQFLGALPEGEVRAFIEKLLPPAQLAHAERAIDEGRLDEAERLLGEIKPDIDWDDRVETLRQGLSFARAGGGEKDLAAKVAANPADLDSRLALAGALAARHDYRGALEQLLEIIRRDRAWKDGEARKQMLAIFNLAADDPALVSEYRKKLSSALY
ncbi:MAG TPA: thioredoxin [Burkholderiales bacterium]|jgi:putative thioredoxin|nr:thioredoxin [Burkholderiales bacterium]